MALLCCDTILPSCLTLISLPKLLVRPVTGPVIVKVHTSSICTFANTEAAFIGLDSSCRSPVRSLKGVYAFGFLFACRCISALFNIVHDCDEVFNYWEPLHYLLYGSGLQTWEYR